MLSCDQTVTLLRLDRDDAYQMWILHGVSVYRQVKSSVQERGMVYASETKVRIPAGNLPGDCIPAVGDTLVFAHLESVPRVPSDLKGFPTATVVHVGDNRRGGLPHLLVVGK